MTPSLQSIFLNPVCDPAAFLNQTLPSMEASSSGDKYQITLSKPTAKISNFIPDEIKFIQQQLNSRSRQLLEMEMQQMRMAANSQPVTGANATTSSLPGLSSVKNVQLSTSSSTTHQLTQPPLSQLPLQQLVLPQLKSQIASNPQAAASNIIQQIAQISQTRQQPFTGTISLHNQAKSTLSDLTNQINGVNRLPYATPASTASLPASSHIAAMNLPLVTAGLAPSQQPKVVHIHHHDNDDNHAHSDHSHESASSQYPHALTEQSYQHLNVFESAIKPGSVVSFQSVLSKRKGLSQSEPLIKELPLNRITKFLERKKKKGQLF